MNAPLPSGDFRADPDYAAGQALHATGEALPCPASTALMRGYLDALQPKERPDWANGPRARESFTQCAVDMPPPGHRRGPGRRGKTDDANVLSALPKSISIVDRSGKLLSLQALKKRYAEMMVFACGGNVKQAARLLGDNHQLVYGLLNKRHGRR